jgi:uncharacterized coiled-coil protein SlyX
MSTILRRLLDALLAVILRCRSFKDQLAAKDARIAELETQVAAKDARIVELEAQIPTGEFVTEAEAAIANANALLAEEV